MNCTPPKGEGSAVIVPPEWIIMALLNDKPKPAPPVLSLKAEAASPDASYGGMIVAEEEL